MYVIARNSGEGADRKNEKGDYQLTDIEYANLQKLGANFENVVVVLNVGGIVDTKFFHEIVGLDSLLADEPGRYGRRERLGRRHFRQGNPFR
ncbi:hypothetical protein [Anaeromassilibacillus sp. SJQ-1]|uniref:hypothetical protein n=1 Tax=Anaeromassilibacillus sp. SJQ-1 TaxID=3375419 RepID=UPI003988E32D